jgi:hypothetical protein
MLAGIGCKPAPRSVSNTNKQVRFDIKDGLRELLKEAGIEANPKNKKRPPIKRRNGD